MEEFEDIFVVFFQIVAMLFNRQEIVTFGKLKPSVQEMLRCNFTLEHLAQIKHIYPEAYEFRQEKIKDFHLPSHKWKYDLVITPKVDVKSGRNTPEVDSIPQTTMERSMNPSVMLERRRRLFHLLTEKVKDEHDKFLTNLTSPIKAARDQLKRYHAAFDVNCCPPISKDELPQAPQEEIVTAQKVLGNEIVPFSNGI